MQERRKGPRQTDWGRLVLGGAPLNQRRPAGVRSATAYYHYPPLKRPHWRWEIVLYFFLGGLASAGYLVAALAEWSARPGDRAIARAGRYLALAGMSISPLLLIRDLGRPERFHHMLRLFKLRSPMSVGSWAIGGFGLITGLAALGQAASDGWLGSSRLARTAALVPQRGLALVGGPLAMFVGTYTGVLLAFTNVPLWARNHWLLGPLFFSSALSTGLAAITLLVEGWRSTDHATVTRLHRADLLALAAELALVLASEVRLGQLGRPLTNGRLAAPYRGGVQLAGLLVPWLLQAPALLGRPVPRPLSRVAALLVLVGGLMLRWTLLEAGKLSADDPSAYFAMTRDEGVGSTDA